MQHCDKPYLHVIISAYSLLGSGRTLVPSYPIVSAGIITMVVLEPVPHNEDLVMSPLVIWA